MATDYDLAPLFLGTVQDTYGAADLRRPYSDILQKGVLDAASVAVVQRAAGANMSVDVGSGAAPNIAYIPGTSVADQGLYRARFSGAVKNLAVTSNGSGNPRLDQVVLYIVDSQAAGSPPDKAVLDVLAGTPNASTTIDNRTGAATLPASTLLLADVLVASGASSITNAVIRDRRPWARGAFVAKLRDTGDINITVTSPSELSATLGFQFRLECAGNPLLFVVQGVAICTTTATSLALGIAMDGAALDGYDSLNITSFPATGFYFPASFTQVATPAAGSHVFNILNYRAGGGGTLTLAANSISPLQLSVMEFVRASNDNGAS